MDEVENEDHNSPLADEEERTENNYVQSSSDEEKPHEYSGPVPSAPEDPSIPHSSISYPKASDSSSSSDNEENFEPVYKRSQTIEQKISSLNEYGIEIQVNNPQIKSTTFRKHVLYTVAGNDSIGGFQVQRRYKEFLALRKILVVEWPGCCIIQLPPKQAMGNLQADFIEARMKLLGYFIKNLSKYRYLLVSEEFQLFLRGPTDFHKSGIMGRPVSYYQISQKYNKVFEQYAFYTRTPETEKEISDVTEFFNHGKGLIEKFEAQCKLSQQVFKQIDDGTNKIMGNIKDLTRFYGEKIIEVRQRDKIEDPYEELLAWTRNTLLEIQGVLEGIGRRADLERSKSLTLQKIEEEKKNILKRQSGKKKIIQYFNKKSSEFYISQSENEIKNLEQSTTSLDCILNFSSAMMLKDEMPDFKNRKIFTLGVVVDISCERSQKELEGIIEQLKELEAKI